MARPWGSRYICANVHLLACDAASGKREPRRVGCVLSMTRADLPDDVRRFVLTSIPSVPYLEAILLLRSEPATEWDAPRAARRLYVAEKQAAELLQTLAEGGIAQALSQQPPRYRYHPTTEELAQRLEQLAHAYARNLVAVTDLIHSRIDKRAQQFADAFRLRKDS